MTISFARQLLQWTCHCLPCASKLEERASAAWKKTQQTEQSTFVKSSIASALDDAEGDTAITQATLI